MNTGAFPYWTSSAAVFLAVLQMLLLGYTALGRGKCDTPGLAALPHG